MRAVTRPGDTVAIESPAYYALLEVLASLDLQVVEVASHPRTASTSTGSSGCCERQPIAAIAMVSNFSNPTGSCMTDDAKRRLVGLVETYDVPLVEDDVYGDLAFDGVRPKAVKAFDRDGRVLYCGSYSKTLSPGLRVGWSIPGRYQNQLELLKLVVNQATATAPQLAIAVVPRERRVRPPPAPGPALVPRRRWSRRSTPVDAPLPGRAPATPPRAAGTSCGSSSPTASTRSPSTTRPPTAGRPDRARPDVLAVAAATGTSSASTPASPSPTRPSTRSSCWGSWWQSSSRRSASQHGLVLGRAIAIRGGLT